MSSLGWSGRVGWDPLADVLDRVSSLEAASSTVNVAAVTSALPDPALLPDGTLYAVLSATANGQPSLFVVSGGAWVKTLQAFTPTISVAAAVGAGAGELPETLAVGAGVDGVLGAGWALSADSFARPAGVSGSPLALDEIEIGALGAGLWRVAVELNYDSPAPASAVLTRFFLQRAVGAGAFADVANGELARLDQDAPAPVTGISQVGLVTALSVAAADRLRVVVRHDDVGARNYEFNKFTVAMNQVAATPT